MSNILDLKGVKFFAIIVLAVAVLATFGAVAIQKASADCSITMTLRVGSSGAEVMCLQSIVGATADGAFGPLTKAAVMAWQSGHGLVADGVVGPLTRAALAGLASSGGPFPAGCSSSSGFSTSTGQPCSGGSNLPAGCTSTAGYSPTTGTKCDSSGSGPVSSGPLAGDAGTIDDVNTLSQYSGEEVGDGQSAVKVLGFEVQASNDGDIALNSMKVHFVLTNGSGSTRLEDYVDSVSIWEGSTKVGSADAADFNRDSSGVYTKVVSLSGAVVRSDATEKFYLTVDAVNNLDSGDIDSETVTVDIDNIRFTDGSGVTTTESDVGNTNAMNVTVAFVSFSTSADTELKVSTNNTPDAAVVKVDTTSNTDNVVLLKGKLKLEGTSDVWLDELPITLTATNTSGSITAITGSVTLTLGGNTYTESTGTNCLLETDFSTPDTCSTSGSDSAGILFDNLDYTIKAGSTVNFTVSADINDLDATVGAAVNFDAGDSLLASLTTAGRAFITAENEAGDQLTNSTEMTGNALGNAQTFRDAGIDVSLVSAAWVSTAIGGAGTGNPDLGTYAITFDVTAFGGDMWIDGTKPTLAGTNSTDLDIIPATGGTGTIDAVLTSPTSATMTGTINTTSRFLVTEGTTERFTITAVVTPTVAGGLYSMSLASLSYAASDVDITDALPSLEYTTNLVDFVTDSANLKLTN